ncbi:succinyl-CoA synthetase [Magnetospirillum fulvum MGU-K5]|uniref:Succinate--CoA ligase [ADP-forming] subunit beta n=1 Tax=Magnetospirillum fulvum MGU-K5 TaxID=1316936 RepID=S9THN1_MAGFU|nr:succinyl-CoA synthetase [Magnetospirillum fulvum MGU-K5]
MAYTPAEAGQVAESLGGPVWVVKAQIHAGGRGKGHFLGDSSGKGGVRVVKSIKDVEDTVSQIMGKVLVTAQTGPAGREVKRVYVEQGCDIKRELYLGMLIDRATSRITIMASTEGGMEIEEVAAHHPEKITKVAIDPVQGFQAYHGRQIAFSLGLEGKQVNSAVKFIGALYKAFVDLDMSIAEINPLVVSGDGDVIALDAKINFDDNALFRHKDVEELRDEAEEDPAELEAARHSLNYIKLDGSIGCMVNGAGLAMATMDIIKLYGGSPANFLDVGGGATKERVTTAFKLILSDPNVEGILVNIFGGIMRCDVIAEGVIAAAREVSLNVPLVVRLEGTNVELGKKIMAQSGLPIIAADNLADAAEKVVKAVKEAA